MSRSNSERRLGAQLVDEYLLVEQIGQGAMATVYRARELESDREVALKIGAALNPARLERFRREGHITASLNHPNIVRVHGAGVFESRPYLVYQFVDGARTLSGTLETWPLRQRIEALRDVAKALGYAHRRGIVHRDVKPDNVLVAPDGSILLADFGLATAESLDRMTRSGVMLGTPLYMAPELARTTGKSIQPQSDVYSLGVMLYETLTGEHPYRHAGLAAILDPKQRSFQTPAEREQSVSPGLSAICMRALARDPSKRFPSGIELAAAFDAWLAKGDEAAPGRTRAALVLLVLGALGGAIALALLPASAPAVTPSATPTPSAEAAVPLPSVAPRSPELVATVARLRKRAAERPLNDTAFALSLAKLRGQLSPHEATDRALADEVMALLLDQRCQWETWGLTCLEALAKTGARPTPHAQAATLSETLWAVHSMSEEFGNRELSRAYTALVELDVDVEGVKHVYDQRVPAPESAGTVVERYLRNRALLEVQNRPDDSAPLYADLVAVGRSTELGPNTRARALSEGSLSVRDPQARLELMAEARRLDPEGGTTYLFWAHALLWAGEKERGWRELQEGWRRWRSQYRTRQGAVTVEGDRLDLSLRFLLRNGMLAEATLIHQESKTDPLWAPTGGGARNKALYFVREGLRKERVRNWLEEGGPPNQLGAAARRRR